jgi:hypothetical protein
MEIIPQSNVRTAISVMLGFVRRTCMTGFGDSEQLVLLWNERLLNSRLTTSLEFGPRAYRKVELLRCSTARFYMYVD